MPELMSVTESSDGDYEGEDSSEEEEEDEEDEDDGGVSESEFGDMEEEHLQDFMREAQKLINGQDFPKELPKDVANNPLLRLFKQLTGRKASLDPRLKAEKTRRPFFGPPRPPPKPAQPAPKATPKPAPAAAQKPAPSAVSAQQQQQQPPHPAQPAQSQKVTMEEVVDEEEGGKKKKKKKKKPKKKKTAEPAGDPEEDDFAPLPSPTAAPGAAGPSKPAPPPPKPAGPIRRPAEVIASYDPLASRVSLAFGPETAQSAHSYLQSIQTESKVKEKVKSRPEASGTFAKGFLNRTADKDKGKEKDKDGEQKNFLQRAKMNISKKASTFMSQILRPQKDEGRGKRGMRWQDFEKTMIAMGFEVDGSTAGSSVRFTPRNGHLPITFHKPHPDTFIHQIMLREFGKRLRGHYGWTAEQFAGFEGDAPD